MVIEATKFRLLDPTVKPLIESASLAPRPHDLNGKVVGLLANGKRNADRLLDAVFSLLEARYQFKDVVRLNKGDPSRPAPEPIMDELLQQCDVVITGIGD